MFNLKPKTEINEVIDSEIKWKLLVDESTGKRIEFGGYPLFYDVVGDTVLLRCKGAEGTDKEMCDIADMNFMYGKPRFGECKVTYLGDYLYIDCLKDTIAHAAKVKRVVLKLKRKKINANNESERNKARGEKV